MQNNGKLREECGVFGVFSKTRADVAHTVYYGLYSLQHRGQESCGIVVNDDGVFASHKDTGLVGEVFSRGVLSSLPEGRMAVGHVRYGTTGGLTRANCQPIEVNHLKGKMALAHNGNLTNSYELRSELENRGAIFHTTSDTETIAYVITGERLKKGSIEDAVLSAMGRLDGAYSIVLMSAQKLLAFRDIRGFRPLCYGVCPDGTYVASSESCALEAVGATFVRDVEPGELVVFSDAGVKSYRTGKTAEKTLCAFEYIYFSRPDSVVDGVGVHSARVKAGRILARTHPVDADVVIGVPDSGLDAALGYSRESGIPYGIGLIKNKYIGRTFISPGQDSRRDMVRIKLSPVKDAVEGKRIVLIDDSIVRGTTSSRIVRLLREAGAKEIHMRVSAPPFIDACYYGTDIDSRENLIAVSHTPEETAKLIGADSLGYLPVSGLSEMAGSERICKACFTGEYPTAKPTDTRKDRFERRLSEKDGERKENDDK